MKELTIGKLRGLQQCSTKQGALAVMALDHRNNLRNALNPANPDQTTDEDLSAFKMLVARALAPAASAILLDPEFGAFQAVAGGAVPGTTGLVVAVEATGYTGDGHARESQVLPGWSVAQAKRMGASAIKLLVYYHPASPTAADIEHLTRQVADDCRAHDMAFFLEPLSYSLVPGQKRLTGPERGDVVIETARRLTPLGGDVLKAEFPLDVVDQPDETAWAEACAALSAASEIPWVLLSASVDYETYVRQVTVACEQGASGVAVGRAVWKEAVEAQGEDRGRFLREIAVPRMQRVTALCDALATPWAAFYRAPEPGGSFYATY